MKSQTKNKKIESVKKVKSKKKIAFFGLFSILVIFVGVVLILNLVHKKPTEDNSNGNNYTDLAYDSLTQNYTYIIKENGTYSNSKINDDTSKYAIITGVNAQALPAGSDGFNLKFPENVIVNGEQIPVKEINCTIDQNGNAITYGGIYSASTFALQSATDSAFIDAIKRIEVPKRVEYIATGSFNGLKHIKELKLPFIGSQRGNLSASEYGIGYQSAFLSIFGYGERLNGNHVDGFFPGFDSWSYFDGTNAPLENPTVGGLSTVSWYDTDMGATTQFYQPHDLESVEITDEVVVATHAFFNVTMLKNLDISFTTDNWRDKFDTKDYIGDYSFAVCLNLITAKLPESATSLGTGVFSQCKNLGKQDSLNNINGSVTLPRILKTIPDACFEECLSLSEITLPFSVETIGAQAFFDCRGLVKINRSTDGTGSVVTQTADIITLPETVKTIGRQAFRQCIGFVNVVIPNNVTSIGKMAFNGCTSLTNLTLPFIGGEKGASGTDTALFGYIFGEVTDFTPGTQPQDAYVFQTNSGDPTDSVEANRHSYYIPMSLANVNILNESSITAGAFMNCSMIKTLTITSSAEDGVVDDNMVIGKGALYGCTGLTDLTIPFVGRMDSVAGANLGWIFGSNSYGNNDVSAVQMSDGTGYWYIPNALKTVRLQHQTTLKTNAFYKTTMVENLIVSKATQATERNVFYDCVSLQTLEMPFVGQHRGAESYRDWWWSYDASIRNSMIWLFSFMGRGVTGHYENAWVTDWQGARWDSSIPSSLESITITDDTYIPGYAFRGFAGVTKISIENNDNKLSYIEEGILSGCESLETLEVPFIGSDANTNRLDRFNYTIGFLFGRSAYGTSYLASQAGYNFFIPKQLTTIKINSNVKYVSAWSFANMSSVNSIEISGVVDTIGYASFYNDLHLSKLTMEGANYTNVADYAFANCATLGEMENFIPTTVRTIGNYAFMGTSISKVRDEIKGLITSIGNYAFSNCNQLQAFDFSDFTSLNSVGSGVFAGCKRLIDVRKITFLTPYMFKDCTSLEGVNLDEYFNITSALDYIPEGLFYGCISLKSPGTTNGLVFNSISNNVKTIGSYAFKNCESLTAFQLPETLEEIQAGAFQNCKKLEKMRIVRSCYIIPAGTNGSTDLTDLGVFYGCNDDFYLEVYYSEALWPSHWGYNWNCYYPVYVIGDNSTNVFTYEYSDDVKGYLITGFNTDDYDFYVQLNNTYSQYYFEDTVTFPSTYNGLPVKGIIEGAFEHYDENGNDIDPGIDYFEKVNTFVLGENFTELGNGVLSFGDRTVYIYSQSTIAQAQRVTAPTTNSFIPTKIGGKVNNLPYYNYQGISYENEESYASRAMIFYKDAWRFVGTKPTILMDALEFELEDETYSYQLGRAIEPKIISIDAKENAIVSTNEAIREDGEDLIYNIFYTYDPYSLGYDMDTITGISNVHYSYSNNVNVGTGRINFTSNTSALYGSTVKTFQILRYELQLFHSPSDNAGLAIGSYANAFASYFNDKVANAGYVNDGTNGKTSTVIQRSYGVPWTVSNWQQGGYVLNLPEGFKIIGTLTTTSDNVGDYISCRQDISSMIQGSGSFRWIGTPTVLDENGNVVTSNFRFIITAYVEIIPYKIDSSSTGNLRWDGTLKDDGNYHYNYTGNVIVPTPYVFDASLGRMEANFRVVTDQVAIEPYDIPGYAFVYTATIQSCSPNFEFVGNQNPQIQFVIDKGEIKITMNVDYTLQDDDDYYRYSGGFTSWTNTNGFNMSVDGCGPNSIIYGDLITSGWEKGVYSSAYNSTAPGALVGSFGWDPSNPLRIVSSTRHDGDETGPMLVEYDSDNTTNNRYNVTLDIKCTISLIKFDYALSINEFVPDHDIQTDTTSWNEQVLALDDSLQIISRNFTDSTMNSVDKLLITYGVDGYEHSLGVLIRNVFLTNYGATVSFQVVGGTTSTPTYKFKEIPSPIPTVQLNLSISKKNYEPESRSIELTLAKGNFNFNNPLDKEYDRKPVNGLNALLRRPADLDSCDIEFTWFDGYTNDLLASAPKEIGYYKVNIIATGSQYFNDFTTDNDFYFNITRRRITIKVIDSEAPYDSKLYDGQPWTYNPINATIGINGESLNLLEGDKLTGSFTSRSEAVGLYQSVDSLGNSTNDFFERVKTTVSNDTLGDQSKNYIVVFEGDYEILPRQFKYEINVDNSFDNQDASGVYTFTYNGNYHRATVRVIEPTSNYMVYYSLQNPMAGAAEVEWSTYPYYFNQPSDGTSVYTTYVKLVADTYETVYDQVAIKITGLNVDIIPVQREFTYDGFSHTLNLATTPSWATVYYYDFTGLGSSFNQLDPDSFEWSTVPPSHTEIGDYYIAVRAIATNYNTTTTYFIMSIVDNGPQLSMNIVGDNVPYDRLLHGITISNISNSLHLSDLVVSVAIKDNNYLNNPQWLNVTFNETAPASAIYKGDFLKDAGEYPLYIRVISRGYRPLILGSSPADTVTVNITKLNFELDCDFYQDIYDGNYHTGEIKLQQGSTDRLIINGSVNDGDISYQYAKVVDGIEEIFNLTVYYGLIVNGQVVYTTEIQRYKNVTNTPMYIKVCADNFEDYIANGTIIITKGHVNIAYGDPQEIQYLARSVQDGDFDITTCHDGARVYSFREYVTNPVTGAITLSSYYINNPTNLGKYRAYVSFADTQNCEADDIEFDFEIVPRILTVEYDHELEYTGEPQMPSPTITTGTTDIVQYVANMYDPLNPTVQPAVPTLPGTYYFKLSEVYHNENYTLSAEDQNELEFKIVNRKIYITYDDELPYNSNQPISIYAHYISSNIQSDSDAFTLSNILAVDSLTATLTTQLGVRGVYSLMAVYSYDASQGKYVKKNNTMPVNSFGINADPLKVFNTSTQADAVYYDIVFNVTIKIVYPKLEVQYDEEQSVIFDGNQHYINFNITSSGTVIESYQYWLGDVEDSDSTDVTSQNIPLRNVGTYFVNFRISSYNYEPFVGRIKFTIEQLDLVCTIDDFNGIYNGQSQYATYHNHNNVTLGPNESPKLSYFNKGILDANNIKMSDIEKFMKNPGQLGYEKYGVLNNAKSDSMIDAGDYYAVLYYEDLPSNNISGVYVIKQIRLEQRTLYFKFIGTDPVVSWKYYDGQKYGGIHFIDSTWSCVYDTDPTSDNFLADAGLIAGHYIYNGDFFQDENQIKYTFRTVSANARGNADNENNGDPYQAPGDFEFEYFIIKKGSSGNLASNYRPAFNQITDANGNDVYPFQITIKRIELNKFDVFDGEQEYDGNEIVPKVDSPSDGDLQIFYYKTDENYNVLSTDNQRYYQQTDVGYYLVYVHKKIGTNYYEWKYPQNPDPNYDFLDSDGVAYRIARIHVIPKKINVNWGTTEVEYDGYDHEATPTIVDVFGNTLLISYKLYDIRYNLVPHETKMRNAGYYYIEADLTNVTGITNANNYEITNLRTTYIINKRSYDISYSTNEPWLLDYWSKNYTQDDFDEFLEGFTLDLTIRTISPAAGVYQYASQFVLSGTATDRDGNTFYNEGINIFENEQLYVLDNFQFNMNLYVVLDSKAIRVQTTDIDREYNGQDVSPIINVVSHSSGYTLSYFGVTLNPDGSLPAGFEVGEIVYGSVKPIYRNVGKYRVYYKATANGDDGVTNSATGYTDITIRQATAYLNIDSINKIYDGTAISSVNVRGGFNGDYDSLGNLIKNPTYPNNRNSLLNFEFKIDGQSDASYSSDFHPIDAGTYWVRITSSADGNPAYMQNYTTLDTIENTFKFTITPATLVFNVDDDKVVNQDTGITYNTGEHTLLNNVSGTSFNLSGLLGQDEFTYKIVSNVGVTLRRTTYLYTDAIARGDISYDYYGNNNNTFNLTWKTTSNSSSTPTDNSKNYYVKLIFSLKIHFPYMTVDPINDVVTAYDGNPKSFAVLSDITNKVLNPNTGFTISYSNRLSSNPNDYQPTDITMTNPGTTNVFFRIAAPEFEDYFGQAKMIVNHKDRTINVADGALDKFYDAVAYDSSSWNNLLGLVTTTDTDEPLPTTGWRIVYFDALKDRDDETKWSISSDERASVLNAGDYIFRLTIPAGTLYGETIVERHFQIKRITYTISSQQDVETTYNGSMWSYNLGDALLNNNSIFTISGLLNQSADGNIVNHHITSAVIVSDNALSGTYVQNAGDPSNRGRLDISDQYSYTIVDNNGVDVRINYEYNLDFKLIIKKGKITFTTNIPSSGIFAYVPEGITPIVNAVPSGYPIEYSETQSGTYSTSPIKKFECGTYSFWARCINVPNYEDEYQQFTYTIAKQKNNLVIYPLDKIYDTYPVSPIIKTNDIAGEASTYPGIIIKYYDENEQNETAVAPKNVGTYWVAIIFPDTSNYTGVEVKQKFTISPRELDVNIAKKILTYNAKEQAPDYTITSNIVVNLNVGSDYTIKYFAQSDLTTPITKPKNVGSYSMLFTLSGTGENSTYNNFVFSNGQKEIRIDYEIEKAKVIFAVSEAHFPYTNSPITISLSYISTSGLPSGVTLDSYIISLTGNSGTYDINCPYDSTDFTNYFKWNNNNNQPVLTYNQQTESLDNYDITMKMMIVVAVGDLPYAVTEYVGQYDGLAHTINFQISQLSPDMTVEYSRDQVNWFNALPTETNVTNGAVHIFVKVTSSLYNNGQPTILGLPGSSDYNKFTITINKADLVVEQPNVDLNKVYDGNVTQPPTNIHLNTYGTDLLQPNYHFYALDKTDVSGNHYNEVARIETSEVGRYYLIIEYKDNQNYNDASSLPIYYEITPRSILVSMNDKSKVYDSLPWEGTISNDPQVLGALADGTITPLPGVVESGLVNGHYFNATIKTKSANAGTYALENDFIYKSSYRIYDYANNNEIDINNYKVVLKLNVLISNADFWTDENNFIIKFFDGHGIYDGVTEYFISHSWTNADGNTSYPLIQIPDGLTQTDLLRIYDSLISYNDIGFNVSDSDWTTTPIGKKFGTTTIYIKVAAPNYNTYYTQAQIIVDAVPSGIIIDDRGILASDKVYNGYPYEYDTIVVRSDKPNDTRVPYFKFYYRNTDGTIGNEVLDANGQNVAPTDAGNYILRVYLDADPTNGYANYESDNIPFNVLKAKVPVYWGADHIVTSTINGNTVYKYEMYYTGQERIPLARAYGIIDISQSPNYHQYELIPLNVTADRSAIAIGSYIATATIASEDYKKNYELLNPTTGYDIIKSVLLDPNKPITNPVFPNDPSDPSLPDSPNNPNHPNSPDNPINLSTLEGIEFLAHQYNPKAPIANTPFIYGEQIIIEVRFIYSDRNPEIYYYYVNRPNVQTYSNSNGVIWNITSIYDSNFSLISTNPTCIFQFEFPQELQTPTFDVVAKLTDKNNYAWNTNGDSADKNIIVHMDALSLDPDPNDPNPDPTNPKIWVDPPSNSTKLYDGTPQEFDQSQSLEEIKVWYNINGTPDPSDDILIPNTKYKVYYGNNINPTSNDNNAFNNAYVIIVSNSDYIYSFKFGDYDAYKTLKDAHPNDPLYVNKNVNEAIAQGAAFTFEIVSPEPQYIALKEDSVMKFVSYDLGYDDNTNMELVYTYGISSEDRNSALEQLVAGETNITTIIEKKKYSMYKLGHIMFEKNLKYILSQVKNNLTHIAVYKEDGTSIWDGAVDPTLSDSNDVADAIGSGTYIVLFDSDDSNTRKALDAVEIVVVGDVDGDGILTGNDVTVTAIRANQMIDYTDVTQYYHSTYLAGLMIENWNYYFGANVTVIQNAVNSMDINYFETNFYSQRINQTN